MDEDAFRTAMRRLAEPEPAPADAMQAITDRVRVIWRRRVARVAVATAAVVATSGVVVSQVAFTSSPLSPSSEGGMSCEERQAVGYAELEAFATSAVEGIEHSSPKQLDVCGDTGSPSTVLDIETKHWSGRLQAQRYFLQRGWEEDEPGGSLQSSDGAYELNCITTGDEFGMRFVTLRFFENADN